MKYTNNEKKVLLLGASGMLGISISQILKNNKVIFLSPSSKKLNLDSLSNLNNFFSKNKFQYVINCAGKVGGIFDNFNNQSIYYEKNLSIGNNVISTCKKYKIKNLINICSSCMYPTNFKKKMSEDCLHMGKLEKTNLGYAIAKLTSATYLEIVRNELKTNYSNIIPCNLYGPNDNFDPMTSHLLASIIRKIYYAKKNNLKEVEAWGSGKVKREFLYVDDLANFIVNCIIKDHSLPTYLNIGFGKDYKIIDYYKFVMKSFKYHCKIKFDKSKPDGVERKLIDSNLAIKKFKWYPKTNIENGIKKTIKFFQDNYV